MTDSIQHRSSASVRTGSGISCSGPQRSSAPLLLSRIPPPVRGRGGVCNPGKTSRNLSFLRRERQDKFKVSAPSVHGTRSPVRPHWARSRRARIYAVPEPGPGPQQLLRCWIRSGLKIGAAMGWRGGGKRRRGGRGRREEGGRKEGGERKERRNNDKSRTERP